MLFSGFSSPLMVNKVVYATFGCIYSTRRRWLWILWRQSVTVYWLCVGPAVRRYSSTPDITPHDRTNCTATGLQWVPVGREWIVARTPSFRGGHSTSTGLDWVPAGREWIVARTPSFRGRLDVNF